MQDEEETAGILSYFKVDDDVLRKSNRKDLKILIREQYYWQTVKKGCLLFAQFVKIVLKTSRKYDTFFYK